MFYGSSDSGTGQILVVLSLGVFAISSTETEHTESLPELCCRVGTEAASHREHGNRVVTLYFLFVFANIHKHRMCGWGVFLPEPWCGVKSLVVIPRGLFPFRRHNLGWLAALLHEKQFLICNLQNETCFVYFTENDYIRCTTKNNRRVG